MLPVGLGRTCFPHLKRIRSVYEGVLCLADVSNISVPGSYLYVGAKVNGPSWNPRNTKPIINSYDLILLYVYYTYTLSYYATFRTPQINYTYVKTTICLI